VNKIFVCIDAERFYYNQLIFLVMKNRTEFNFNTAKIISGVLLALKKCFLKRVCFQGNTGKYDNVLSEYVILSDHMLSDSIMLSAANMLL
jgi:hypothetical protein